jgi:hypothetical protein
MFGCSLWTWLKAKEAACRGEWSVVAKKLVSRRKHLRSLGLTGTRTVAATNDGQLVTLPYT